MFAPNWQRTTRTKRGGSKRNREYRNIHKNGNDGRLKTSLAMSTTNSTDNMPPNTSVWSEVDGSGSQIITRPERLLKSSQLTAHLKQFLPGKSYAIMTVFPSKCEGEDKGSALFTGSTDLS